jgi:hypothetical protein
MKRKNLQFESGFRVVLGNRISQAAEMVLPPGQTEGGPENRQSQCRSVALRRCWNRYSDREWETLLPGRRDAHAN